VAQAGKMKQGKRRGTTRRDSLLYISIGVCVVLSVVAYAFSVPPRTPFPLKPLMALGVTIVVFGYLVQSYWHLRSSAGFWGVWLLALLVHAGGYFALLTAYRDLPILLMGIAAGPEFLAISAILNALSFRSGGEPR